MRTFLFVLWKIRWSFALLIWMTIWFYWLIKSSRRISICIISLGRQKKKKKKRWCWVLVFPIVAEFADWTWEEFKKYRLGAPQECSATTKGSHKLTDVVLPESVHPYIYSRQLESKVLTVVEFWLKGLNISLTDLYRVKNINIIKFTRIFELLKSFFFFLWFINMMEEHEVLYPILLFSSSEGTKEGQIFIYKFIIYTNFPFFVN